MAKKVELPIQNSNKQHNALKDALSLINKEYGEGTATLMVGEFDRNISFISTGSLLLDLAIGGGFPRGRIVECLGIPSSGKTTFALSTVAEAQKMGLRCIYFDYEHALDPIYMKALGVDLSKLIIATPKTIEDGFNIMNDLLEKGLIDVLVIDSVNAAITQNELVGEVGDHFMGVKAKRMSEGLAKMSQFIANANALAIFINQVRYKIGVMGDATTTSGGASLEFYASVRLKIHRNQSVSNQISVGTGENKELIATDVNIRVIKNKVGNPYRVAETRINYGEGIDKVFEIAPLAIKTGVIHKQGNTYSYNDEKIAGKKDDVHVWLKENPQLHLELLAKIKEAVGSKDVNAIEEEIETLDYDPVTGEIFETENEE